jgi:hypothetical protein
MKARARKPQSVKLWAWNAVTASADTGNTATWDEEAEGEGIVDKEERRLQYAKVFLLAAIAVALVVMMLRHW